MSSPWRLAAMSSRTPTEVYDRGKNSGNPFSRWCSAYLCLKAISVSVFAETQKYEYKSVKRSCQKCAREIFSRCKFLSHLKRNIDIYHTVVKNTRFKDVREHCASLLRTLYMTWRVPRVETQQNIKLMTFAVTWSANIFVGCSMIPTISGFFWPTGVPF